MTAASRVTSAVVYARQAVFQSFHIDLLTSLRDPEIRRVDGSVHHHIKLYTLAFDCRRNVWP